MSLHRRIYADLEGLILSGALSPGDRIPFEHELTERYDCSRMTVSKAISELAGRGLVTRVWQIFPGDRYDLVARFSSAHSPVLAKEPRR